MKQEVVLGIALFVCAACCGDGASPDRRASEQMSPPEKEAYDACLQRNMAVATAWEIIEENCAQEVRGGGGL